MPSQVRKAGEESKGELQGEMFHGISAQVLRFSTRTAAASRENLRTEISQNS